MQQMSVTSEVRCELETRPYTNLHEVTHVEWAMIQRLTRLDKM